VPEYSSHRGNSSFGTLIEVAFIYITPKSNMPLIAGRQGVY
jgi:hypothetical protein